MATRPEMTSHGVARAVVPVSRTVRSNSRGRWPNQPVESFSLPVPLAVACTRSRSNDEAFGTNASSAALVNGRLAQNIQGKGLLGRVGLAVPLLNLGARDPSECFAFEGRVPLTVKTPSPLPLQSIAAAVRVDDWMLRSFVASEVPLALMSADQISRFVVPVTCVLPRSKLNVIDVPEAEVDSPSS